MRAATSAQEEGDPYPNGIDRSMAEAAPAEVSHRLSTRTPFTVVYQESSPESTLRVAIEANKLTDASTKERTRTRFIVAGMAANKVNWIVGPP